MKIPFYKSIVFWIVAPVIIVGMILTGILIVSLAPRVQAYLRADFEAHLRLASDLGLRVCDNNFNQLLDLRLEANQEMNEAYKRESLEQIKSISKGLPRVRMVVVTDNKFIIASSSKIEGDAFELPASTDIDDRIHSLVFEGEEIKAHIRYFPYWDWHILSIIRNYDYLAPILAMRRIIFASTAVVLLAMILTFVLVFYRSVRNPIQRLINATRKVAEGNLETIKTVTHDEIGQLTDHFNNMVDSLQSKTTQVEGLLDQLRKSEERYRKLVDMSPEAVVVMQDGEIKYINSGGVKLFGVAGPEDLIGRPTKVLVHQDYWVFQESRLGKIVDDQLSLPPTEYLCVKANGEEFFVDSTGTYIEYEGKPAILSIIRDISERKSTEEALRKNEERLVRSKKMESLGLLAGGVAHDLNNVLSGVVSYPDLILMELDDDSKLRRPIETIQDSGLRATAIVQDLLTIARGVAISKKPIGIKNVVDEYISSPEFRELRDFNPDIDVQVGLSDDLFNPDPA